MVCVLALIFVAAAYCWFPRVVLLLLLNVAFVSAVCYLLVCGCRRLLLLVASCRYCCFSRQAVAAAAAAAAAAGLGLMLRMLLLDKCRCCCSWLTVVAVARG
jgi:hypothetical protein